MTCVFATFRVLVLLIEAFLDAQVADFETFLLREHVEAKTEIQERLDRSIDIAAILTGDRTLQLAVKCLMDDTLASGFTTNL